MKSAKTIPAEASDLIAELGQRVRVARQRRRWSILNLAERVGVDRNTVNALELGSPGVTIATYITTLWVLGLEKTLDRVASPDADAHGKALELSRLPAKVRKTTKMADENAF